MVPRRVRSVDIGNSVAHTLQLKQRYIWIVNHRSFSFGGYSFYCAHIRVDNGRIQKWEQYVNTLFLMAHRWKCKTIHMYYVYMAIPLHKINTTYSRQIQSFLWFTRRTRLTHADICRMLQIESTIAFSQKCESENIICLTTKTVTIFVLFSPFFAKLKPQKRYRGASNKMDSTKSNQYFVGAIYTHILSRCAPLMAS